MNACFVSNEFLATQFLKFLPRTLDADDLAKKRPHQVTRGIREKRATSRRKIFREALNRVFMVAKRTQGMEQMYPALSHSVLFDVSY